MRLKTTMVTCCITLELRWHHFVTLYTRDDPQKGNFPKEDEKLRDLEASKAVSWRLFGIDEDELSQLGLLVLSL